MDMEKFIRRENLALFKKRLAEAHTNAEREVLLKLLADEEANERPPKNGVLQPRCSAARPGVEAAVSNKINAHRASWYVAFRRPNDVPVAYVRNSKVFQNELEAKNFVAERLAEGCDVTAGTLNPHYPKKTIGPSRITDWLEPE